MHQVAVRYTLSMFLASIIACSLFVLMVALIATSDSSIDENPALRLADIIMYKREIEEIAKEKKPEKQQDEAQSPELPDLVLDNPDPSFESLNISSINHDSALEINFGGLSVNDGEYLPIVKVAPQYPRRALQRGLEGYVLLEFTVTSQGSVKDPKVLESSPPGIFDRAAIRAALKFKYKPRVIDGNPTKVEGVRNRIKFTLAKD